MPPSSQSSVFLDKITFKARTTQDVGGLPLLLWFGTGYTGQTNSGLSSRIIEPESTLPTGMGASGDVCYRTLDIEDQLLMANRTYAFMPRFASGGSGGVHPEMEVGFMGEYSYGGGAAFTFDGGFGYNTILNNETAFFLHGTAVPEPSTLSLLIVGTVLVVGLLPILRRHSRPSRFGGQ